MKSRKNKCENGITLVALVITIIVLLILAGISLNTLLGKNGMITITQQAKQNMLNAALQENELLQNLVNYIDTESSDGSTPSPEPDPDVLITNIQASSTSNIFYEGDTIPITLTITPENATNKTVTYQSSEPNIIAMEGNSLVAKKVGNATITISTTDGSNLSTQISFTIKSSLEKWIDSGQVAQKNETVYDAFHNKVVIPAGFSVTADATTVDKGIVIQDNDLNQFVWVPISNIDGSGTNLITKSDNTTVEITLGRYLFDTAGKPSCQQLGSQYQTPVMVAEDFQELPTFRASIDLETNGGQNETARNLSGFVTSVATNNGYYMARYEASFGGSTTDKKALSKPSTTCSETGFNYTTGYLWNQVTEGDAAKASKNMYEENSYFETDLQNSYTWDTTIVYLQAMGYTNYANKNGLSISTVLQNTGSTIDKACNIYDMCGNLREWTTESTGPKTENNNISGSVARGGNYNGSTTRYTCNRFSNNVVDPGKYVGFRPILYLK